MGKSDRMRKYEAILFYDKEMKPRDWVSKIPPLQFPKDRSGSSWVIYMIPPFAGAIVRFGVGLEGTSDYVSVYLDVFSILGATEVPYWEVYIEDNPNFPTRCAMEDTESLMKLIQQALSEGVSFSKAVE
tara:strand:- start:43 stop:429 length:387 start_codon:yes stop_codon:yes gene_type:complete